MHESRGRCEEQKRPSAVLERAATGTTDGGRGRVVYAEREGAMARCSETGQRVWDQRGGGSE